MSRRLAPAAVAVVALAALVPFVPSAAEAGLKDTCFGQEPNVVGTSGNDTISVSTDEGGTNVTINGKSRFIPASYVAISSGDGKDRIRYTGDPGGAVICSGKGDDTIEGTLITRVSAGSGDDTVTTYLQCGGAVDFYGAETVRITGFDSEEEGPCN